MTHKKQHAVEEVLERLQTDRFDNSCYKKEELELQAEDIIHYHNIEKESFSDIVVDSDVNQQQCESTIRFLSTK